MMIRECDFSIHDLPCGCLVTTPNREIAFANAYFADELGWELDGLVGRSIEVLLSRGSQIFCDSYIYPMLLKDGYCDEAQLNCRTPSGTTMPIIVNAKRLDDGRVTWSVTDARNRNNLLDELAAARRLAEEKAIEAEAANAAKTLFLTTMSHELRTPLNGVIGMASAFDRTSLSDAQRAMVATISNAGTHLLHLVDDVLDVAKIESGGIDMVPSQFNGNDMAGDACATVRPDAEAKGLRMVIDVSPSVDTIITGDPKRIRQVVMNVLTNAIKFTTHGMIDVHVDLEAGSEEGQAVLAVSVSDTGPGVPDDQKHRIFERFGQGSHTEGHDHGGIGLGLAISKTICTLHGGDLTVLDNPGGGSVFAATFAVGAERAVATNARHPVEVAPLERPLRLLFADDNPMNQKVAEALFSIFSVTTVFVDSGQQALDLLACDAFDAALIDINMPDMSGIECVRAYRKMEISKGRERLPMIAFTANVMAEQIAGYIENGFDRHFAKPIDVQSVSECIEWIAEERRTVLA